MPYLILIIGLLVGIYALIRFFAKARPSQIRAFFRILIITIYFVILLFLALTGRIIISIALLILAIPFGISYLKGKMLSNKKDIKKDDE